MGFVDREELYDLSRQVDLVLCFGCDNPDNCERWPSQVIMPLEEAWRVVIDGMPFYGEWLDGISLGQKFDERFLVPWSEMERRVIEREGEFIEIPAWLLGNSWEGAPLSSCANLKQLGDSGDYCEA
jgi:hypothetical protein